MGKMKYLSYMVLVSVLSCIDSTTLVAAERHMMQPRVPADQLEAARALKNPLPFSAEVVQKGKVLYEGKGTCFNCHGLSGRGDGPGGATLDPSPRNFRHRGMWRHRNGRRNFLGHKAWISRNRDDSLRRYVDR